MTSNDFIIRTERNVIEVVLSSEGKFDTLRRDFEEFRAETRQNFAVMASEVRGLDKTVDRMISMFSLWLMLLTIAVAIAPMLKEFFVYRHEKNLSENNKSLNEKISALESQIKDLQQKLS